MFLIKEDLKSGSSLCIDYFDDDNVLQAIMLSDHLIYYHFSKCSDSNFILSFDNGNPLSFWHWKKNKLFRQFYDGKYELDDTLFSIVFNNAGGYMI